MIQKIRIDDRLLHGQVAYSWKAALNYEAIVIANDGAANDEFRSSALRLVKPDNVQIAIRTVEDAIKLLKNEKLVSMRVFVIVASPEDAEKIYAGIDETPVLNVGGVQKKDSSRTFSSNSFLSEDEVETLDRIHASGIEIEVKQIPAYRDRDYADLRDKYNK